MRSWVPPPWWWVGTPCPSSTPASFSPSTGAELHGTNPTDFWIVPSSGLIVRERESVAMSQGGVGYNEDMDATLTSLDPAR